MRPNLDEKLSVQAFNEFRWLKAELIDFCVQHGISTEGSKHHIRRRVASYLAAQRRLNGTSDGTHRKN